MMIMTCTYIILLSLLQVTVTTVPFPPNARRRSAATAAVVANAGAAAKCPPVGHLPRYLQQYLCSLAARSQLPAFCRCNAFINAAYPPQRTTQTVPVTAIQPVTSTSATTTTTTALDILTTQTTVTTIPTPISTATTTTTTTTAVTPAQALCTGLGYGMGTRPWQLDRYGVDHQRWPLVLLIFAFPNSIRFVNACLLKLQVQLHLASICGREKTA